jgi:phosphatidylinositol alpha 1,6-mannosyltransferase
MRILFCTDTYPPQVNGVSVVTALTVRGLERRGWECTVIAPRYPGTAIAPGDGAATHIVAIPSLPLPRYPDIRVAVPGARVRDTIARVKPDLVHCATEFVLGRLGMRAVRELGIPVCTSYHTDFTRYAAAYGLPWLAGPVTRSIMRFHSRAARVFTPSSHARDELRRHGVEQVEVWGRGVDASQFHPSRRSAALRMSNGLGEALTILFVGRLAPEKEVQLVIDAFAIVENALPPGSVRLLVAGAGPDAEALRRRASPGVTFIGSVDHATVLPAVYASADIFVMASTTETLGLVGLEAMASGIPVVATPAGGVAEYLRHGHNGLAFAPREVAGCASAMLALADDPVLRRRLAAGARRTAEERSWDQELDRLDLAYREVLLSRDRGPRSGSHPCRAA